MLVKSFVGYTSIAFTVLIPDLIGGSLTFSSSRESITTKNGDARLNGANVDRIAPLRTTTDLNITTDNSDSIQSLFDNVSEAESIIEREMRVVERLTEFFWAMQSVTVDVTEAATRVIYIHALNELSDRILDHKSKIDETATSTNEMMKLALAEIQNFGHSEETLVLTSSHSIEFGHDSNDKEAPQYRSLTQLTSRSRGHSDTSFSEEGSHSGTTTVIKHKSKSVNIDMSGALNGVANLVRKSMQTHAQTSEPLHQHYHL